jgi:hypothetical protein
MRFSTSTKRWPMKFSSILLCILSSGTATLATEPVETASVSLSEIGLSGLEIIGESQASEVRGLGSGASGTSVLIGALIDPSTGSIANFFQVQSSGASGASASYSNSISAGFEWSINGMIQRFQAEIGGFGASFGR